MERGLAKPPATNDPQWLERTVVVALGASLSGPWPSREALLEAALARLQGVGLCLEARSSWWGSTAWPNSADPPFVNGVALFRSNDPPRKILANLLDVECEFGRAREGENAPRTLDLDLVAHGRSVVDDGDLILPHPRAHKRLFVMGPLAEVAPTWRHPTLGETAETLARRAPIGVDARPIGRAALHKKP